MNKQLRESTEIRLLILRRVTPSKEDAHSLTAFALPQLADTASGPSSTASNSARSSDVSTCHEADLIMEGSDVKPSAPDAARSNQATQALAKDMIARAVDCATSKLAYSEPPLPPPPPPVLVGASEEAEEMAYAEAAHKEAHEEQVKEMKEAHGLVPAAVSSAVLSVAPCDASIKQPDAEEGRFTVELPTASEQPEAEPLKTGGGEPKANTPHPSQLHLGHKQRFTNRPAPLSERRNGVQGSQVGVGASHPTGLLHAVRLVRDTADTAPSSTTPPSLVGGQQMSLHRSDREWAAAVTGSPRSYIAEGIVAERVLSLEELANPNLAQPAAVRPAQLSVEESGEKDEERAVAGSLARTVSRTWQVSPTKRSRASRPHWVSTPTLSPASRQLAC